MDMYPFPELSVSFPKIPSREFAGPVLRHDSAKPHVLQQTASHNGETSPAAPAARRFPADRYSYRMVSTGLSLDACHEGTMAATVERKTANTDMKTTNSGFTSVGMVSM